MQATTSQTIIIDADFPVSVESRSLAQRACNQLNDLTDAYYSTFDPTFHRQYVADMNVLLAQISYCGYNVNLTDEDGFVLL